MADHLGPRELGRGRGACFDAASALIASGCSVLVAHHFMGHATATETLNTYGHLWPNDEELMRQAIEDAFGSSSRTVRRTAEDETPGSGRLNVRIVFA